MNFSFLLTSEALEFIKFFVPLLGAIIAWYINERRKQAWEEYQRKESNYKDLILALKGFYESAGPDRGELKRKFIDQINLCWLYCPDEVIRAAYEFINSVLVERKEPASEKDKQLALGSLMCAIRNDLLSRHITKKTSLQPSEFMHLTSS